MTKARVLLAGLLLALATPAVHASAATTRTVHLTNDGPAPKSLTLAAGDHVVFVNDDVVPHQVTSHQGWQYDSGAVPPRQTSSPTPALTAPGTYTYTDDRGIVFLPQTFIGRLVVPAPKPSPTPTTSPSPRTSPTTSSSPSPSAEPSVTSEPTPTATPSPTGSAGPSSSPSPGVTTPAPSPSTSGPAPDLEYGDPRALVQGSPHRYGLPALLATVAAGGVLSLLVRYLLALPEGLRARDGERDRDGG